MLQLNNFQILSHTFIKLMLHSQMNAKSIHILSLWKRCLKWYNFFKHELYSREVGTGLNTDVQNLECTFNGYKWLKITQKNIHIRKLHNTIKTRMNFQAKQCDFVFNSFIKAHLKKLLQVLNYKWQDVFSVHRTSPISNIQNTINV